MNRLLEIYNRKLESGELHPDSDQLRAIIGLNALNNFLALEETENFFYKVLRKIRHDASPKGFYFYGDVGRGKSMVMDLFFAQVPIQGKRRVHFH